MEAKAFAQQDILSIPQGDGALDLRISSGVPYTEATSLSSRSGALSQADPKRRSSTSHESVYGLSEEEAVQDVLHP